MSPEVRAKSARFTTRVRVEMMDDKHTWMLLAPLCWIDARGNHGSVKAGSVTDFASVPRLIRPLLISQMRTARPAIKHDADYQEQLVPQNVADWDFYWSMRWEGEDAAIAFVYLVFLRAFGWYAYYDHNTNPRWWSKPAMFAECCTVGVILFIVCAAVLLLRALYYLLLKLVRRS